jgi:hypothetical protein
VAAVENTAPSPGSSPGTRGPSEAGKQHRWQRARPLVPREGESLVYRAFKRALQIARASVIVRGNADVTDSNRRVRTRMHGGVAGVGGWPPPLCRSSRRFAFVVAQRSLARESEFVRSDRTAHTKMALCPGWRVLPPWPELFFATDELCLLCCRKPDSVTEAAAPYPWIAETICERRTIRP